MVAFKIGRTHKTTLLGHSKVLHLQEMLRSSQGLHCSSTFRLLTVLRLSKALRRRQALRPLRLSSRISPPLQPYNRAFHSFQTQTMKNPLGYLPSYTPNC